MATILAVDHVALAIPGGGKDEATLFYVGVLGFSDQAKPPHLASRGLWLSRDTVQRHLGIAESLAPAARRTRHPLSMIATRSVAR